MMSSGLSTTSNSPYFTEFVDKIEFHLMKSDHPDLYILKEGLIKLEETLTYANNRMVAKYSEKMRKKACRRTNEV